MMDQTLAKLIENENEAEGRIDFAATEFEKELNQDLLKKAKELTNIYINYRKLEFEFNKALDCRNNIYHVLSQLGKGRDNG